MSCKGDPAWQTLCHRTSCHDRMRLVSTSPAEGVTELRFRNSTKFQNGWRLQNFLTLFGDQAELIYELFQSHQKPAPVVREQVVPRRTSMFSLNSCFSRQPGPRTISPCRTTLICARPTGNQSNFAVSKFRKVALSSVRCYVKQIGAQGSSCPAPVFREKISNAKGKSVKDAEPSVQS